MALTYVYTLNSINDFGSVKALQYKVVVTGTYATGNTADITSSATLGLNSIDFISLTLDGAGAQTNGVTLIAPDLTNNKWWMYWSKTAGQTFAEVDAGTTLTGLTFQMMVYGVA